MSENNAMKSDLVKVAADFKSTSENGNDDLTAEIDALKITELKDSLTGESGSSSEDEFDDEEVDSDYFQDKDNDQPENYIRFLFDPEVPEVILNEYVIAEIAKFLNFKGLSSLRQTNKLWSAGATPQFVQKSGIVLRSWLSKKKLKAFEEETKIFKGAATNLKIIFNTESFKPNMMAFNDIFEKLAPSLQSLISCSKLDETVLCFRASIKLPALTSLNLSNDESESLVFQLIYSAAPNLHQLVVSSISSELFAPLLFEDGSRNWSLAPKLKSLKVRRSFSNELSSDELSTLTNFPQTWEHLDITVSLWDESFNELLEKNKDTLITLMLVKSMGLFYFDEQVPIFQQIFPKLQKLGLELQGHRFEFEGNSVTYSEAFPNLTSLSLKYLPYIHELDWTRTPRLIWSWLFSPQVFNGLKNFDLEFIGSYEAFVRNNGIGEDWAEIMFPNAKIKIH